MRPPWPDAGEERDPPEVLWEDGERRFCRVRHPGSDGTAHERIAVFPAAGHPTPLSIGRFAHEYALRAFLDGAWALRPVELVRGGRPALILEYEKGEPLDRLIGRPMETGRFLQLALALAGAVGKLHERGLVHKDIKPANVLVDSANHRAWRVWLTGFGVASRLANEHQAPEPPEVISGTLSHMSPEQTGRMNRSIDSRSDLYSLGVTLYQALTGSLPFMAADPMEWVHCHVARTPPAPAARAGGVPPQLSAMVMKLLAKTPEERYQTGAGLERDLRRCLDEWESRRAIGEFPLGEHDNPARLLVPQKSYGRAGEVQALLAAFDEVAVAGTVKLVLVAGRSGIGKSHVGHELRKVLVPSRALFASGKFDQQKREIPYAALAQAFQGLTRQLLVKPEDELNGWRDDILRALEPNVGLIVDFVPELKFVLGEQPGVADLPPPEAKVRFQRALRQLIGVFARPQHPLVLFLDDVQWLDEATLDLLEDLLIHPDNQPLLLVAACRDDEVGPEHPLARKVEAIRAAGIEVPQISLAPLLPEVLAELIADALHCEQRHALPLAHVVHQRTAGNPLFASQFIHALVEEGSIAFDAGNAKWTWDLKQIGARGYADNVVELIVERLGRAPPSARQALDALACLGNLATTSMLALVRQTPEEEVHADLWEARRLELVVRTEDAYRFVHDRVREAAYSLIPEDRRAQAHLRIGRLLKAGPEDAIFDIVGQLNRGSVLMTSQEERDELAELNLRAGKRAEAAGAPAAALGYMNASETLLGTDNWQRRRELMFELGTHRADCEVMMGEVTRGQQRIIDLSSRVVTLIERATVTGPLVATHFMLGQPDLGIAACLSCLRHAGMDIPPHPTDAQAQTAAERIRSLLVGRSVEELAALPVMTDPASRSIVEVLTSIIPSAMHTDKNLMALMLCAAIEISLEQGNSDTSCFAYVYVSALPGWPFSDFETGYAFGRLGRILAARDDMQRLRGNVYNLFAMRIMPWATHVASCRELARSGFECADKGGNRIQAGASHGAIITNLLVSGEPLAEVEKEAEFNLELARKSAWGQVIEGANTQAAFIRNLRGATRQFGSLADNRFDEQRMLDGLANHTVMSFSAFAYLTRRLQALFLAGDYAAAVDASVQAQPFLSVLPAVLEVAELAFYGALARAAAWHMAPEEERGQHLQALLEYRRQIDAAALNCKANFENRAALVAAELACIEGRDADAMRLYEQAIRSARDNSFVHHEAIATELAGRFYAARGFDKIARAYLRDARSCYLQWGADGKVRQLDDRYPYLRDDAAPLGPANTVQAPVEHLDLATVIEVLQAVSGETDLQKLIATVMRLGLEQAGAQRGLLMLPLGDGYQIEAQAVVGADGVDVSMRPSIVGDADLPLSMFQYVTRTREAVLLQDASTADTFSEDPYVQRHRARSVLCMPLLKQTRTVGVIYLENNVTSGVFTPERMTLLKLLASEAAVSLENARLYLDLQEREARVRRLFNANIIGIFTWRADGRILDANETFLRIIGFGIDDLSSDSLTWKRLLPAGLGGIAEQRRMEILAADGAPAFEAEYVKKDGTHVPVLVGAALFHAATDEGVAFVLDLTELKRAETALNSARAELAHVSRVTTLSTMTASIAHEVNQPLSGIATNASTCLRMLDADRLNVDGARETARRILRDVGRATEVISRLRAMFANREFEPEPLDLNEAVREVLALSSSDLQRNRIVVRSELDEDVAAITGDRVQLQQVTLNLVRNASDAMAGIDDRPRQLLIRTEPDADDHVRVTVRDTGVGIGRESADKLFSAFYTTKSGGMGIGLSVSRSIIEHHHGRLWATANEGPGTTFAFSIPRRVQVGRA